MWSSQNANHEGTLHTKTCVCPLPSPSSLYLQYTYSLLTNISCRGIPNRQSRIPCRHCTKDENVQAIQGRSCSTGRSQEGGRAGLRPIWSTEWHEWQRCSATSITDHRHHDGATSQWFRCSKNERRAPRANLKPNTADAPEPDGRQDVANSRPSWTERGRGHGRISFEHNERSCMSKVLCFL
jgi:hypothetical protein